MRSVLMRTSRLCALILMIIAKSFGNARFLVLSKDTLACFSNASTNMKKYWKGPDGGVMGLQRSLCSRSKGGGSSLGSFHYDVLIENFPWEHALHFPVYSASRMQSGCPSKMGIIRLSIVAPGWPSLPCQSPDLVGVSPTNTSTACMLVPQFATVGPLWRHCLQLGASNSTHAFRPRLAFVIALNLCSFDPIAGSGPLRSHARTRSCRNPRVGSSPSIAFWGSKLVTANALSCLKGAQPVGGQILMLYRPVVPVVVVARVSPLRRNSMASSPCTPSVVRWTSWARRSL